MESPRRIVVVGFDGAQALDFTGPLEVFDVAGRLSRGRYEHELLSAGGASFSTTSGLRIAADGSLAADEQAIDTLLVAGGAGVEAAAGDPEFVQAIAAAAGRARRVTSVCTGAFLLAAAGLLDGRRATTHWAAAARFADRHPLIDVDPAPIFVRDDPVWTSAGVSAGIDLALALVEDDHGSAAALEVARWLVVFAKRPGGQAQFSEPLAAQLAEREPIRAAQDHVRAHPDAELTVEALAELAQMSIRGFSRAFRREVGATPGAYVEMVRVERAVQMLQATSADAAQIAQTCGFGTVETLRRAFHRRMGVSPIQYRDRVRGAGQSAA